MTKYRDLLREFIESVRGKDFSEIIILADREATQAYRNALRSCHEPHHNSSGWCQYSKTLTNMIHFLRSEVKPKKTESFAYPLFYSVQNGIEQKNQEFFRSCMAKHERLKPVSHGRLADYHHRCPVFHHMHHFDGKAEVGLRPSGVDT